MDQIKRRDRNRANGEGWLKKRKDGRGYDVGLHVYMPDGTTRRRATIRKTRAGADRWLTEQKASRNAGIIIGDDNPRFSSYLSVWLEDSVRGSVKPVTYKHYRRMVKNHISPVLGGVKIKALTPRHIQRLHAMKRDQGLSVATRRHIHTTLKKALSQATAWGDIPTNPAATIKPPGGRSEGVEERGEEIRPFSEEELVRVFAASKDHRLHALYVLAPASGLREGELCALAWPDVILPDAGKGTIRVRRAVVETEHGFAVDEPKTKGSRRNVEIPVGVVATLKNHRQRQIEERLAAKSWQDESLVFPNADGGLLTRYRLGYHWRKMRTAASVDSAHQFRDFRHTFATLLFARGYHPKKVQEAMGHRSIRLTLDTYSHWVPSMGGTADALEDVFGD